VLNWIQKNVHVQIGDQEENSIKLGELLYNGDINKRIRYARMEHTELNDLFEKHDYIKKILNKNEKNTISSSVFKLILEIQQ